MEAVVDQVEALTALQALYEDELCGFVRRRVRNPDDADDIRQQTMLQAIRGLSGFRGSNLRAWLFSIARRVITDNFREQNRATFVPVDGLPEEHLTDRGAEIRAICESREHLEQFLACMQARVDVEGFVALLLADLYGFRDADSAARLRMPLTSFKWLLYLARQRMRECTGDTCSLDGADGTLSVTSCSSASEGCPHVGTPHKPCAVSIRASRSGLSRNELIALRRQLISDLGM